MRIDEGVKLVVGTKQQITKELAALDRQRVALAPTSKEEDPRDES